MYIIFLNNIYINKYKEGDYMKDMLNIFEVAKKINIEDNIEPYGNYKAKISNYKCDNKKAKLILVTSINPTPQGEGKTTLSIGLNDSLNKLGEKSIVVLREPSLGPVFGTKGGAAGGGKAVVESVNDINLHFNGDFHAITSANNLLSAVIDNHIFQGNELKIKDVIFKRSLDVNDRALRSVKLDNRSDTFVITPASEIMAILCLSKDIDDLKNKLDNIIVGYNESDEPVFAKDLKCTDALTILLKDAIKPNLVQTGYNNPAIIHGGPFANIAHGCNSIIATNYALGVCDYVITEAGFGSDMGALKFFDIKCRLNKIYPDAVVINATIKALKYNGEGSLEKGICNLGFHINLMKKFNSNIIVSLNKFNDDNDDDIKYLKDYVDSFNVDFVISTMYQDGEDGCLKLASKIKNLEDNNIKYEVYSTDEDIYIKIEKVCNLYGANRIEYTDLAKEKIAKIKDTMYEKLPICIAKTPASITDNKDVLGWPKDFTMTVTDILVQNGAGFIVIYMGDIMTMPGLGKKSKYLGMDYKKYLN